MSISRRLSGGLALALVAIPLPPATLASADNTPASVVSVLAPIPAVAAIEAKLGSMTIREGPIEDFSSEGSRAVTYSGADSTCKIDVTVLRERGRSRLEFWWQGQVLLAARERVWDYGDWITALSTDKSLPMALVGDDLVDYGSVGARLWSKGGTPVSGVPARERADELAATASQIRAAVEGHR